MVFEPGKRSQLVAQRRGEVQGTIGGDRHFDRRAVIFRGSEPHTVLGALGANRLQRDAATRGHRLARRQEHRHDSPVPLEGSTYRSREGVIDQDPDASFEDANASGCSRSKRKVTRRSCTLQYSSGCAASTNRSQGNVIRPVSPRARKRKTPRRIGGSLEREKRFELSTLALARRCSTAELFPREVMRFDDGLTTCRLTGGQAGFFLTLLFAPGHRASRAFSRMPESTYLRSRPRRRSRSRPGSCRPG